MTENQFTQDQDIVSDTDEPAMSEQRLKPWMQRAPLLPEAGAAGRPLVMVIAVICFLACMSLGGVFVINKATKVWTGDLRSSITLQITGDSPQDIQSKTATALEFLRGTEGVVSVKQISDDETAKMLSAYNLPDGLPIPSLIAIEATDSLYNDLDRLQADLETQIPGANLDDHDEWYDNLAQSATMLKLLALSLFLLILLAIYSIIIFATRAGLAANRDIVDVLHLVGATDMFIAKEMQRRFLILSLRGAMAGLSGAVLISLLLITVLQRRDQSGYFIPQVGFDPVLLIWLLGVPILTCLIAAWSARTTVLKTLRTRM
ncbi:MAG: cell division protein FtsX [bacterium]